MARRLEDIQRQYLLGRTMADDAFNALLAWQAPRVLVAMQVTGELLPDVPQVSRV